MTEHNILIIALTISLKSLQFLFAIIW